MKLKTSHGEINVPDWLVEATREKTRKTWWLPFPALKAHIKKRGFRGIIRELLRQKLGRSEQRKRKKDGKLAELPHVVQLESLRKRIK